MQQHTAPTVTTAAALLLLEGRTVPVTRTADGSFEFEARAGSSYQLTFEG